MASRLEGYTCLEQGQHLPAGLSAPSAAGAWLCGCFRTPLALHATCIPLHRQRLPLLLARPLWPGPRSSNVRLAHLSLVLVLCPDGTGCSKAPQSRKARTRRTPDGGRPCRSPTPSPRLEKHLEKPQCVQFRAAYGPAQWGFLKAESDVPQISPFTSRGRAEALRQRTMCRPGTLQAPGTMAPSNSSLETWPQHTQRKDTDERKGWSRMAAWAPGSAEGLV